MRREALVVGILVVVSVFAACGRQPDVTDADVKDADAVLEGKSGCAAVFADPSQKRISTRDPNKEFKWSLAGQCSGNAKLRVSNFVLLSDPGQRCEEASQADHFDVTPAQGAKVVHARLKRQEQDQPEGTHRVYCYTLEVWEGNQLMHLVDPELDILW